ncbi:hypothetical protein K458DRAFT_423170 [Lentithecium fluviatile CBS 122367]|uniref:SURP motif domain-containing protein n=1 Tax=Lentithecium fluviatile CBS 122367 TaxID=1168545 RepID=A0A6G1IKG7_9PLEO|nr:hypothetical protein K458DRAFT_423170 [Lentithecium fluviatile CBS 122367]
MAFSFSFKNAGKAQLGSKAKAKAEADAKAREEEDALAKIMADVENEHGSSGGGGGGILGEPEEDHRREEDVFVPSGSKRHFTNRRSTKSGPGTLTAGPGMGFPNLGGPGGFGGLAHPGYGAPAGPRGYAGPAQASFTAPAGAVAREGARADESVYTTMVAKVSNLPRTMTPQDVEALFAGFEKLKVVGVEKLPLSPLPGSRRGARTAPMKITFDKDTKFVDLVDALNKLNDKKYLGDGHYLHIDRYLGDRGGSTRKQKEPFGATLHVSKHVSKGVAPPADLGGNSRDRPREREEVNSRMLVTANAPPDLPTLKLIHQTIEGVINGGKEFEAVLMEDPRVREQERFAWLFDHKHPLNRYYRWTLHKILTSSTRPDVFHGEPEWKGPKESFKDEYATGLEDLIFSSDDGGEKQDNEDEKPVRTMVSAVDDYPSRPDTIYGVMRPKHRAALIWLLCSVPPAHIKYDEVAPITAFAMEHATEGLDEVVDLLVTNIFQPFIYSEANPRKQQPTSEDQARTRSQNPTLVINALRIISDVAMTSTKVGGACFRYRPVIGEQLVDRKVFEYLETLPSAFLLGQLSKTHYRDEIKATLDLWKDEKLFDPHILDHIDNAFNARQNAKEQAEAERKLVEKRKRKRGTVPQTALGVGRAGNGAQMDMDQDDAAAIGSMDGANDSRDSPKGPTVSTRVEEANSEPELMEDVAQQEPKLSAAPVEIPGETAAARARRLRPKAEDMFAFDED